MNNLRSKENISKTILLVASCSLLVTMLGCDAFVRKFTRKPKKEDLPKEELVLFPEEYKPTMDKEQVYRQYFLFWQSWQEELITALLRSGNHKKQVDCAEEAIKNLTSLKPLIKAEKQKKLDIYITQLKDLRDQIKMDAYSSRADVNIQEAERIKKGILRDFSYSKISKDIS